ncbi:PilN domain-containing protein [Halanaerobacter jeridensis]|uniref:Tfp pilus assembly protein PilN n=1 Tax=Halanaerobacter jeridensis TaxID=706427 RepID=A0A939BQB5_9FIRM|nr:PilN domain-containing protein [Halanaerobacter jeridensis]MBM7557948.1 Tfp pilus assembly protein PilN [Halanaerobacter jeridensis]
MINLLPPEYKRKGLFDLPKQWLLLGGIAIIAVILVVVYSYTSLIVDERIATKKLTIAENKLSNLRTELKTIKTLKQKKEQVETQLEEKKEILGTKLEITPILNSLQKLVSNDSWIVSFNSLGKNQFEFIGYAVDNREIGELFKKLKASPKFMDISIDLVKQRELDKKQYNKSKIVYYRITGKLANKGGTSNDQLE